MAFITPAEISKKATNAYSKFLGLWISGDDADFFPYRVRANLKLDSGNPASSIIAIETLLKKSKENRGWGYSVRRTETRSRDFGKNLIPESIMIETLPDLLRLAEVESQFEQTKEVAERLRSEHPSLADWVKRNVKSLHKCHASLEGLLAVVNFFQSNPWPDCYARQMPVEVDTKFVRRHSRILRQWLDVLLPDSAIDPGESKFERRFGLRDGQTHRGTRFLDEALMKELGESHIELSLPIRSLARLRVSNATIFVVENKLNLLTLPNFHRGIGIQGEGNAVNRLEGIAWLNNNRIVYWGDNDVDGFLILSRLRNIFPHVESIMMDLKTIQAHSRWSVESNSNQALPPTNLTEAERIAFDFCSANNFRLEQEKILQPFVDLVFAKLVGHGADS